MSPDRWAVAKESDRVRWDCEPLARVGPLRFGMALREAAAAMDAHGFTSDTSPIANHGPFRQLRVQFRRTDHASTGQADVVAYFVDSIGLTCITVDARTGPQVTLDGIRLIGRRPSELASEIAEHLRDIGKTLQFTPERDISSEEWGMLPRAQRAGDALLTRAVFGRPNSWAYTMDDCIPADEWESHPVIGSVR
jgi:hypothetical protein